MDKSVDNFDSSFGPLVARVQKNEARLRFLTWALAILALSAAFTFVYQRGYTDAVLSIERDDETLKHGFNACIDQLKRKK